jgi:lysozyme
MDVVQLRLELERDEGRVDAIYLDHLGYLTFGVGHLVKTSDPEHGWLVDTPVQPSRVFEAFEEDVQDTLKHLDKIFPPSDENDHLWQMPEEVQLILCNMCFNMGPTRLRKFKKMIAAINVQDWDEAANQMVDSKWYTQVPNRAGRLVSRMRALTGLYV